MNSKDTDLRIKLNRHSKSQGESAAFDVEKIDESDLLNDTTLVDAKLK